MCGLNWDIFLILGWMCVGENLVGVKLTKVFVLIVTGNGF